MTMTLPLLKLPSLPWVWPGQVCVTPVSLTHAGTNNARLAQMLRQLATYYYKDADTLFVVRVAQGMVHMGKGLLSLSPFYHNRELMSPVGVAGLLITLVAMLDAKNSILSTNHSAILGAYPYFLYYLVPAMYPRFLITLDQELNPVTTTVRVGQAVDTVG